jgi:hypothetical protein
MRRHLPPTMLALALALGAAAAQETTMTWPEATELLQRERSLAEACARVVKRFTPKYPATALAASELEYETARAEFNAVIAGLQAALIADDEPPPLATVERRLATGTETRRAFCDKARALAPPQDPLVKGVDRRGDRRHGQPDHRVGRDDLEQAARQRPSASRQPQERSRRREVAGLRGDRGLLTALLRLGAAGMRAA